MAAAVIVDGIRSPYGKRFGDLAGTHPARLLGQVQAGLLERTGIDPTAIEQVIGGCVTQAGEQSNNITRTSWLDRGLPYQTAATTVDCACGSSLQAVHMINALIASGAVSAGIACGVESMSRVFLGAAGGDAGNPYPDGFDVDLPDQFLAAERIVQRRGISRADIDAFAADSQKKAIRAWDAGVFDEQVIGILTFERTRRGIDLIHTVTDPVHRGEGAASVLVRTVFAAIREQDLQVTVICPFVESWIQRHPHEVAGIRFAD